jgi:hypothetical protein
MLTTPFAFSEQFFSQLKIQSTGPEMQRKGKSNLDSASNHSINSVVPTAPNTDDLDTSTLNA